MTTSNLNERAASERAMHNARMVHADFNMAPFTIAWEVTRACAYACVHCRADAMHTPDPNELNTEEAMHLIDRLAIAWVRWRRFSETAQLDPSDVDPSLALQQFTELTEAFDTLVLDIHEGRRRVPHWRTLKSYREPR